MAFLDTSEKRKSLIITAILTSVLLLAFTFVTVLTELEPPEEQGIAINFGNTDVGSGPVEPAEATKVSPAKSRSEAQQEQLDNVATQDNTDAPTIKSDPKNDNPVKKPADKPAKKPDPKPDNSVLDALNSVSGAKPADGTTTQGQGPGDGAGNKGDLNGDPYANSYFGKGKGTGGKGFGLSGRGKVSGSGAEPDCFESGRVIVEIEVDRNGRVVKATPGKQGSTNTAKCLLDAARKSAMTYKFTAAPDARDIQIGFVEVIFKVGE
ncbi:MAG: hypothetical protein NWQ19_04280 [Nonlabens sp.]|nr:hypothetical protein [Nonlabens sp.]